MGTTPTLELSTLVPDRVTVKIQSELWPEGRLYELRKYDELGIAQLQEVYEIGDRAEKLMGAEATIDSLSSADAKMLDDWTSKLLDMIFYTELEPEVYKALNQGQRMQVMEVFTEHTRPPTPQNRAQKRTKKTSTGAK